MYAAIVSEFAAAIAAAGLTPPEEIVADDRRHRFSTNGKRSDDSGWYVLHADGTPAGAFGDWRSGVSQTWRARNARQPTPAEQAALRERIRSAQSERERQLQAQHAAARVRAGEIWQDAKPAPASHEYLRAKAIGPHTLRVCRGALAAPMRTADGVMRSLQFIRADGAKRFLTGGRVSACYFGIGALPKAGAPLIVAEGIATAASIHEATGCAVAAAFSASNLSAAATELHRKHRAAHIVIAADRDEFGTGEREAAKAAQAVRGVVALPPALGDFNDLHRTEGAEAVREVFEKICKARA